MKFIEFNKQGLSIDDSDLGIKPIIDAFTTLIIKNHFDRGPIACGVSPSPDFGYFELADRFWRASLCIYSMGATKCFWESGAGYAEPWLFNVRHAVELYIKGFLLHTIWLEDLQKNPHLAVDKEEMNDLKRELGKPHNLRDLYDKYVNRIKNVISVWSSEENGEVPEINKLILSQNTLEIFKELGETDENSFRFRYPSLQQEGTDRLQKLNWHHDQSKLFPKTGLPKESGYFFDHVTVINFLYELLVELINIQKYFEAIATMQDVLNDYWQDMLRDFGGDY